MHVPRELMPLIRRDILKGRDGDRKKTKQIFRSDLDDHLSCARLHRDCLTSARDAASRPKITKGNDGEYTIGESPLGRGAPVTESKNWPIESRQNTDPAGV